MMLSMFPNKPADGRARRSASSRGMANKSTSSYQQRSARLRVALHYCDRSGCERRPCAQPLRDIAAGLAPPFAQVPSERRGVARSGCPSGKRWEALCEGLGRRWTRLACRCKDNTRSGINVRRDPPPTPPCSAPYQISPLPHGTAEPDRPACFAVSRHKPVLPYEGVKPQLGDEVFVAPSASIIGNVKLGHRSSVWYSAILRGEHGSRPSGL